MTDGLPLSHSYNLARLGNAGDEVHFAAGPEERAAIAKWSGVLSLERLEVGVKIAKLSPTRFGLDFKLDADVTQACVVTLEPVPDQIAHQFRRELEFTGSSSARARHKAAEDDSPPDLVLDLDKEEGPEEIQSLHYDLAVPVLEEYALSLEPYPRRPGVQFTPPDEPSQGPESPFAVLKGLK